VGALSAACIGQRIIVLRAQRAIEGAEQAPHALHVITSIDEAADPMPLRGNGVAFAGVATTLGNAIGAATVSWSASHAAQRLGGWELRVALIQSRAEVSGGRITVELAARVTLSATLGQIYLAQTHGYCKQTDVLTDDPTATVYACMESMAHDLAGWLEGVQP
jgi:hypothetical protein